MATYEITLENDQKYLVDIEGELPPGERGQQLLQRALQDQLRWQAATQNTPGSIAEQLVGGGRDALQSWISAPTDLLNVVLGEAASPDPPGGPRRRLVPELPPLTQLPTVQPPQTKIEAGARIAGQAGVDILGMLAGSPGLRQALSRALFPFPQRPPTPLLFEPRAAVARGGIAGAKPVGTVAPAQGALLGELSTEAVNTARALGLPESMDMIKSLSLQDALRERGKILRLLGDDLGLAEEGTAIGEILSAVEQRVLSFR
jgi:hypothetical protein